MKTRDSKFKTMLTYLMVVLIFNACHADTIRVFSDFVKSNIQLSLNEPECNEPENESRESEEKKEEGKEEVKFALPSEFSTGLFSNLWSEYCRHFSFFSADYSQVIYSPPELS